MTKLLIIQKKWTAPRCIPLVQMPQRNQSQWDDLIAEMLLRLEKTGSDDALVYDFDNSHDAKSLGERIRKGKIFDPPLRAETRVTNGVYQVWVYRATPSRVRRNGHHQRRRESPDE